MTREEYFCKEFVDKIYYFCLKKTGSIEEAEDLCSEITVEILNAFAKGIIPESLESYVWTVARNRYARWAKRKHDRSKCEDFSDEILESVASEESLEENLLKEEQINELRRELTLLSREYREILVSYYIEHQKISEISNKLSIPQGTIKTKLSKARQKLMEGMKMARTFGKLSYAPETIEWCVSGGQGTDGSPHRFFWDEIGTKICTNILVEAYKNPSTMQELSIELGIAQPYLEEFVEEMTDATLLLKTGEKEETAVYETNFVIISSEAVRKMNDKLAGIQRPFVKLAKNYLEKSRELQLQAGNYILGRYQEYEEQKWALALRLADDIQWMIYDRRNLQFNYDTIRPYNGSWDVMGVEEYNGPSFMYVGHSTTYNRDGRLNAFYTNSTIDNCNYIDDRNAEIFQKIIKGDCEGISQSELDKVRKFLRKNKEDKYEIAFGVYTKAHNSDTLRCAVPIEVYNNELLPIWEEMMSLADEYMAFCEEVMREKVPKKHMNQFNFCMHSVPFLRGMVVEGLIENGFLKPEEELSDMIGVYTEV